MQRVKYYKIDLQHVLLKFSLCLRLVANMRNNFVRKFHKQIVSTRLLYSLKYQKRKGNSAKR